MKYLYMLDEDNDALTVDALPVRMNTSGLWVAYSEARLTARSYSSS